MAKLSPVSMVECSRCHTATPTVEAVAVRVTFTTITKPVKVTKSRTTEWLCPECRDADPIWNMPPYSSPGDAPTHDVAKGA